MKYAYPHWPAWPKNRAAIIAEIGMNHGGCASLAWKMIRSAHHNGADFVKLQTFVTGEFLHPGLPYYAGIKKMELSPAAQKMLFRRAADEGIKLITTPYDFHSVDIAHEFKPAAYKIASMDNDNLPLLRYIAHKSRPVLVSCGMADLSEIKTIINVVGKQCGCRLVLLHCIPMYPARSTDLNLEKIRMLREKFARFVGFSDHSLGLFAAFSAVSLGAVVIEKHFTLDRGLHKKMPEADHNISIEPSELRQLADFCKYAATSAGDGRQLAKGEKRLRPKIRRGLYARKDMLKGTRISMENTVLLRPVKGVTAGEWDTVSGRKVNKDIRRMQPIRFSDIHL